jgi:hypothetical protein
MSEFSVKSYVDDFRRLDCTYCRDVLGKQCDGSGVILKVASYVLNSLDVKGKLVSELVIVEGRYCPDDEVVLSLQQNSTKGVSMNRVADDMIAVQKNWQKFELTSDND